MARTRTGLALQIVWSLPVWRHAVSPVGEIVIDDLQGNGRAKRLGKAHAGEYLRGVMLDLLATTATIAALATCKIAIDRIDVDGNARRHAGDDRHERWSMRLPCRDKLHDLPFPSIGPRHLAARPCVPRAPHAPARCSSPQ